MIRRLIAIAFAILLASLELAGQSAPLSYSAYTATDVKTPPAAPALGAANSVIADPTFGTQILRVTDTNTNAGQSFISTDAGNHRAWNANATRIQLTGPHGDGWWFEFNPATFKVGDGSSTPKPHAIPSQYAQRWEWSVVNPDLIYVLHGNKIASYNVVTGVTTDLGGPSTAEPVAYYAVVIGQDNWVCAAAGSGVQQTWSKIFCVNPQNPATVKFIDVAARTINGVAQTDPNWPTAAPGQTIGIHGLSGGTGDRWLHVTFAQQSWGGNGDSVMNLTTNTWSLVKGPPTGDLFWGGHVSMGNGTFANGAGNQGGQDSRGVLLRNPDALMNSANYHFIGQPSAPFNGWCDAEHSSWFNSVSTSNAPVVQSRYGGMTGCAFAWTGEIIALATDQSNTVWRFAHNHNGGCYYGESFAQISNDGRWILFSSPWDGTLGADTAFGCSTRIDTFILKLVPNVTPPNGVLAFSQQPTDTVTTMAITPAVAGTLTPAAAHSLTLAVNSGNCTLGGPNLTVTSNGSTGAWSFPATTVSATSTPANCTLKVVDNTNGSVATLVSNSFNVGAAPVETVTLSVATGPCTLMGGPLTVPTSANVWSFPGVTVTATPLPATCTLRVHSSNPAVADITSNAFTVTAAAQPLPIITITAQPGQTVNGSTIVPTVSGTLTPGSVRSLTVRTFQSNCSLGGNQTVTTTASGAFSFPGLTISAVGLPATCTLMISDNSTSGAALDVVSSNFTVIASNLPPPTLTLNWVAQPSTTATGALFVPTVVISVSPLPPLGAPGYPVTLTVTQGNCTLGGTLTQTSSPFVSNTPGMTFYVDLSAVNKGTSCVITASTPNATSITSVPFSITDPLPPLAPLTRYPVFRKP